MPSQKLINKLASLAVNVGVNVQKDQVVVVRATTEVKEIVREVVKEAYLAGARDVFVQWSDDYVSHSGLIYQSLNELIKVPHWLIEQYKDGKHYKILYQN